MKEEKISVIAGIFNCEDTLEEAIECIVSQTYKNWELVLCDDGSTDNTFMIAQAYAERYPDKVIALKNEINMGLNYTLNKCLQHATGDYIGRMDGDDKCSNVRLEKELSVLKRHPDIAIVSTDMVYFDDSGTWGRIYHPTFPEKKDFPHESPFCHAPCLVRKEAFDAVGGYTVDEKLLRVEDYHLWIKMYAAGFRGMNIHEPLYQMRDDRNAYSRRKIKYRLNEAYVKILSVRQLKLPIWMYVYALRPIITGLMPKALYDLLHKMRLQRSQ